MVRCGVCEMAPIVGTRHRKRQAAFAGAEALEALKAEMVETYKEVEEDVEENLTKELESMAPEEQWQALLNMSSYDLCGGCHAALPAEEQRQFEAL